MSRPVGTMGIARTMALGLVAACASGPDTETDTFAVQSPQIQLPGTAIPQFIQPLPLLSIAGGTMATANGNTTLTVRMCELDAQVLPPGFVGTTRVFGYVLGSSCPTTTQDTYIGPVLVNQRGSPTTIRYVNELGTGATTQVPAFKYSVDQTLDWADPEHDGANACAQAGGVPAYGSACAANYAGSIPAVAHLHGGEVPPEIDGGPDAWFTSDGSHHGAAYYTSPLVAAAGNEAVYRYPNTQEASPIWFHDHALGITRINVYAGLAGAYLITDPSLSLPTGLGPAGLVRSGDSDPSDEVTVPLVIQDRSFDTNGQFLMPADAIGGVLSSPNPEHPYWVPEFTGDTILVNGKVWPFMNVEPKRYRFWFINGSNARTYEMFLVDPVTKAPGPPIYVIATDGGYLDAPVAVAPPGKLLMMPGERYEAIIDFSAVPPGSLLLLRNTGKTPYPDGAAPGGTTLGRIMVFRVGPCPSGECGANDTSYDPASGIPIRSGGQQIVRLTDPATGTLAVTATRTRQLTLNEVLAPPSTVIDPVRGLLTTYPGGPLEILVNNTKYGGESARTYGDFTPISVGGHTKLYSELPGEGDTEVWELVNLTADAHPIHLHLVQFQIINRQGFNTNKYGKAYAKAFPAVAGSATCTGGVYCPGFGPPGDYQTGNARALGGNPDIVPYLQGPVRPPAPDEAGWKDTVIAYPGQVTRLAVRWAPTDTPADATASERYFPFDPGGAGLLGYVWHCHIIDHEDNEMMRPDLVQPNPAAPARAIVRGTDY